MKKIVLSFIFLTSLFIITNPSTVKASVTEGVTIGNTVITEDPENPITDTSTWNYNSTTNTLTLNNYEGQGIVNNKTSDFKIILIGENRITNSIQGIYASNANISIDGTNGNLYIKTTDHAQSIAISGKSIELKDGTYKLNAKSIALHASTTNVSIINTAIVEIRDAIIGIQTETALTINSSKVYIESDRTALANNNNSVVIENSIISINSQKNGIISYYTSFNQNTKASIKTSTQAIIGSPENHYQNLVYGGNDINSIQLIENYNNEKYYFVNCTENEEIFFPNKISNLLATVYGMSVYLNWEGDHLESEKYIIILNGKRIELDTEIGNSYVIELDKLVSTYNIEMWTVDSNNTESTHVKTIIESPNNPNTGDNIMYIIYALIITVSTLLTVIIINIKKNKIKQKSC